MTRSEGDWTRFPSVSLQAKTTAPAGSIPTKSWQPAQLRGGSRSLQKRRKLRQHKRFFPGWQIGRIQRHIFAGSCTMTAEMSPNMERMLATPADAEIILKLYQLRTEALM